MAPILVALDGSPRAPDVLSAAIEIARWSGQKLVLFRSFAIPPDLPAGVWRNEGTLVDNIREDAKTYLADRAREAGLTEEILADIRVELGVPWRAICDVARGLHAALIVIGSHGHGAIDRLLGTTAAKIVNHAECSVLVVRKPEPEKA